MSAARIKRPPIYRIFCYQVALVCLLAAMFLIAEGSTAGYSALLGGLTFVIPQLYFMRKAFILSGARAAPNVLLNFYKGEGGKFIMVAAAFAVIFRIVEPLDHFAVFSSFVVLVIVNMFYPYLMGKD